MIAAGELDRRIQIQARADAPDALGQPLPVWSTVATVWAKLEPVRGGESYGAEARSARAEARSARAEVLFRTRYLRGVGPTMRVLFDGEVYDIVDVAEVGRREGLALRCTAFESVSGDGGPVGTRGGA